MSLQCKIVFWSNPILRCSIHFASIEKWLQLIFKLVSQCHEMYEFRSGHERVIFCLFRKQDVLRSICSIIMHLNREFCPKKHIFFVCRPRRLLLLFCSSFSIYEIKVVRIFRRSFGSLSCLAVAFPRRSQQNLLPSICG